MPQVEGQGTAITLENTIEAPFTKFDVEGHSEQESTEGYQLFNNGTDTNIQKEITSINNNGLIILNGTNAAGSIYGSNNSSLPSAKKIATLPAGTYTLKMDKVSGNLTTNSGICAFYIRDGKSKSISEYSINSNTQTQIKTLTLTEETNIYLEIFINVSDWVFNNYTLSFTLVSGTEARDFEPYTNGASPSPNWEQPIKSAGEKTNKFDAYNATYTNNLSYNSNFTQFLSDEAQLRVYYISCKPNTTYSVSKKIGSYLRCGSCASIPANGVAISTSVSSSNNKATIATTAGDKYIYFSPIRSSEIGTLSYEDVINTVKIEEGTQATPYSPYGMGSITEKIVNENYLSLSEATVGTAGVTASISETKMKFNGKMASVTNIFNSIREDKAVSAGTYKLSYTKLSGSTSGSGAWAIYFNFYNANGTKIANKNFASNESGIVKKDLVLSEDVAYYSYNAYCNSTSLIFNDLELGFMITKDTPTDYIAHKEQIYTIPVQQPMRSIGDVRDVFFKNTKDSEYYDENLVENGWYERHYIGELVLNGTENIARELISNNVYKFYINNIENVDYGDANYVPQILCNKLIAVARTPLYLNTQGISSGNGNLQIYTDETKNMTVPEFKTWLENNNLIVNYLKTIPIDLPCTEEQIEILENPPKTCAGQTNIYSEDKVEAYLEVAGLYDLKKLINN